MKLLGSSQVLNHKPLSRQPSVKRGIIDNIVPLSNGRKLVIKRSTEGLSSSNIKFVDSGKLLLRNPLSGRHPYKNFRVDSTRTSIMSLPSNSSDKIAKLQGLYIQQANYSKVSTSNMFTHSKS